MGRLSSFGTPQLSTPQARTSELRHNAWKNWQRRQGCSGFESHIPSCASDCWRDFHQGDALAMSPHQAEGPGKPRPPTDAHKHHFPELEPCSSRKALKIHTVSCLWCSTPGRRNSPASISQLPPFGLVDCMQGARSSPAPAATPRLADKDLKDLHVATPWAERLVMMVDNGPG